MFSTHKHIANHPVATLHIIDLMSAFVANNIGFAYTDVLEVRVTSYLGKGKIHFIRADGGGLYEVVEGVPTPVTTDELVERFKVVKLD